MFTHTCFVVFSSFLAFCISSKSQSHSFSNGPLQIKGIFKSNKNYGKVLLKETAQDLDPKKRLQKKENFA